MLCAILTSDMRTTVPLKSKPSGFTIIEVLIVLAIAGLILMIVFLTVPALQRNSRNSQRKNDVAIVLGKLNDYVSNNNGALPPTCNGGCDNTFLTNAKLSIYDPNSQVGFYNKTDTSYTYPTPPTDVASFTAIDSTQAWILVFNDAVCSNDTLTSSGASNRSVAAAYLIETTNGFTMLCQAIN